MNTLTLIISPDWPQERRECHWVLENSVGQLVRQGYSDPAHWPGVIQASETQSDQLPIRCNLLLAGAQTACHGALLPKVARACSPELIAVAIEEKVLDDPANLHFASVEPVAGETQHLIGVISKNRLESIVRIIDKLGLIPHSAWPLGLCIPTQSAVVNAGEITWRRGDGIFCSAEIDEHLPFWFSIPAPQDEAADSRAIRYAFFGQTPDDSTTQILDGLMVCRVLQPGSPESISIQVPKSAGFLYGDLAPKRSHPSVGPIIRSSLRLAVSFAFIILGLAFVQWAWFAVEASRYSKEITEIFQQSFPKAAMVDPLLQMQRQVAQIRRNTGQLAEGDFLRLVEPLAEFPSGSLLVQEMTFDNGRLRITGSLDGDGVERLRAICRQRGMTLTIDSAQPSDDKKILRFQLAEGGGR